jgi:hypothetical protein
VLVDSANPHLDLVALLPAEAPEENEGVRQARLVLTQETQGTDNLEGIDPAESAAQVRSVASLGALPLVVLTHASDPWINMLVTAFPGFPRELEFGERSGRVIVRSGKGNKARTVPLNASARQALAAYLAPRFGCEPTIKTVAMAWPHGKGEAATLPLWQSQKRGRLTTSAMRQMIDILVRDASTRGLVPAQASAHTPRTT